MYQKLKCTGRLSLHTIDTVSFRSGGERLRLTIDVSYDQGGQLLFLGLLDPELRDGIGVTIDPQTGEVMDAMNQTGLLTRLESAPWEPGEPYRLELHAERIGDSLFTLIRMNGETCDYPAVYAPAFAELKSVVGATLGSGATVSFENADTVLEKVEFRPLAVA